MIFFQGLGVIIFVLVFVSILAFIITVVKTAIQKYFDMYGDRRIFLNYWIFHSILIILVCVYIFFLEPGPWLTIISIFGFVVIMNAADYIYFNRKYFDYIDLKTQLFNTLFFSVASYFMYYLAFWLFFLVSVFIGGIFTP